MNKLLKILTLAFLTTFFIACSANSQNSVNSKSLSQIAYSIKSQDECLKQDGLWKKVGKLQKYTCILKTEDANKECRSSSECEVSCLYKGKSLEVGSKVVGRCSQSTYVFGCKAYVENGLLEPTLCID